MTVQISDSQVTIQVDDAGIEYTHKPSITALSNGGFAVAYTARDTNGNDDCALYVQAYDASGGRIGDNISLPAMFGPNQSFGVWSVEVQGLASGGYAVTWSDKSGYFDYTDHFGTTGRAVTISNDGVVGDVITTASVLGRTGAAAVGALDGGGLVTAYSLLSGETAGLHVVGPWGDARVSTVFSNYYADVVGAGDGFVAGWAYGTSVTGYFSSSGVTVTVGATSDISAFGFGNHSIARLADGGIVFAWASGNAGWARVFNADGSARTDVVQLADHVSGPMEVASRDNDFVVVWDSYDNSRPTAAQAMLNLFSGETGSALLDEAVSVAGNGYNPTVAVTTGGSIAVSWIEGWDVKARMFDVLQSDPPCFLGGTRILTDRGEVPVEQLAAGDLVVTVGGDLRPVVWIGRRKVAAVFADPLRSYPIRIMAGALGENVPNDDLLLSPDHAVRIGDVLINAAALVNGTSIVRETNVPKTFVYYHVELEDHALILAANTPSETFVDNVDRMGFDNWAEHEALYPGGRPIAEMDYPRAKARRQVPMTLRAALDERAMIIGRAMNAVA